MMSFRKKLYLVNGGLITFVIIIASAVLVVIYNTATRNLIRDQLKNHAENILENVNESHLNNEEQLDFIIDKTDKVIYQIWNTDNHLISGSTFANQFTIEPFITSITNDLINFDTVKIGDDPFSILIHPIEYNQIIKGYLLVGVNINDVRLAQFHLIFAIIIIIDVIGSFALTSLYWLMVNKQIRILRNITEFAQDAFDQGEMSQRIPLPDKVDPEISKMIVSLNHSLDKVEDIVNSQKQFLANVSHELRTPLTIVKGNIGLMRLMHQYDHETLVLLEKEVDSLTRFVSDLLLFAQVDSKTDWLQMEDFNFDELISEVYREIKVLGGNEYQIKLLHNERVKIFGDKFRLKQVLLNLCSNAIKFTPKGGIIRMGSRVDNESVIFFISDTGKGIPEDDLPHIFDRSYRVKMPYQNTHLERGFGIGLAVSDWVIKLHKGTISVQSKQNEGTTFTIALPVN